MRAVIVGQAPPRARDRKPGRPLEGLVGDRLARLMGLEGGYEELTALFDVANLLGRYPGRNGRPKGDEFPMADARAAADRLRPHLEEYDLALLLGVKVAAAFRLGRRGFFAAGPWEPGPLGQTGGCTCQSWTYPELGHMRDCPLWRVAVVPHPSGVSRWWNDPHNTEWAKRNLRSLPPLLG